MTRQRLTLDAARHMSFDDLHQQAYGLLAPYEAKIPESADERDVRIGKTLDELPDIYAWLLQLHAYFDHWTEFMANQFNMKSLEYKEMRIKRDLMENCARAAKLRYDGASRRITQEQRHDEESRMPRGRR